MRNREIPIESQKENVGWVRVSTEWLAVQRWHFAVAVGFVSVHVARCSLGTCRSAVSAAVRESV